MIVVRVLIVKCRKGENIKYERFVGEMILEKGGEDGCRCGYTKEETRERDVVPYEFYINLRILRGTEYDFVM